MNVKTKKYLMPGILGGILSMIGDCLLCGVSSYGETSVVDKYVLIWWIVLCRNGKRGRE